MRAIGLRSKHIHIHTVYSNSNIKELLGSWYDSAGYSVNLKG